MSQTRTVTLGLLSAHWAGAMLLWHRIPGRVPLWSGSSEPSAGWAEVTPWSWFGLPTVSLLLVAAIWMLARWLGRYPLFLSLRGLGLYRHLSPEGRGRVLRTVREGLELFALPVVLVFFLVQVGVHEAAVGRTAFPWTLGGLALSMLAFSAVLVILRRRVEGAVEAEWRQGGHPYIQP
jgi:hypothetical protein